ncbi:MAG: small ribosomal subunit Rsm22 family protein [Treponema sp.]|nr:small ribosomal subunit Rsm22 family protein [Treponema sp.]
MNNAKKVHTETRRHGEITNEVKQILNSIPNLIKRTFPIPSKFQSSLPKDIAELSGLLTNNRGKRSLSYLARPNYLSAYLYYFLPWNLYRLCLLLPNLNITLSSGDEITDIGCGPLTFISALWITRPDLRKIKLEINCVDRSAPALEAGKKFFEALSGAENNWKINLIKEDINFIKPIRSALLKRKKANLVSAVNIFNEVYESLPFNNSEGLKQIAANAAAFLNNEALQNAGILTVEPGVPQSGKFISFLRDALIKLNRLPASPCTHTAACPLSVRPLAGGQSKVIRGRNWIDTKKRWCHFAFETFDAPHDLRRLSAAAKLPKDRLVLSFLLTQNSKGDKKEQLAAEISDARVISDAFPLPQNKFGRYGCSNQGLILITGEKSRMENLHSLSLVPKNKLTEFSADNYDKKSGALKKEIK